MLARLVLATLVTAGGASSSADEARDEVVAAAWRVRAVVVTAKSGTRLEVTVEARAPFHLNDDYPLHFDVAPATGLTFPRARVDRKDGVAVQPCADGGHGCRAVVPVPFVATQQAARVGGILAFSACDAEQCLIEKVAVSAPLTAGKR